MREKEQPKSNFVPISGGVNEGDEIKKTLDQFLKFS